PRAHAPHPPGGRGGRPRPRRPRVRLQRRDPCGRPGRPAVVRRERPAGAVRGPAAELREPRLHGADPVARRPRSGRAARASGERGRAPASLTSGSRSAILPGMTALVFVGIAILIGLGIWYSWYAKKKRREELAVAARQLGLDYSSEDTMGCLGLPFDLLRKGDGRGTENVLWGTWQGMGLREFDYWYYEESTDSEGHRSKTYYHFSCAATELPLTAAHLTIAKENVFTRLAD